MRMLRYIALTGVFVLVLVLCYGVTYVLYWTHEGLCILRLLDAASANHVYQLSHSC